MSENKIDAEVILVRDILTIQNLRIPEYQRPYRWEEKNVRQLLEDIMASKTSGKKNYRIGSVILYDNPEEETLDIVDGQQRLTTLYLIMKACSSNNYQNTLKFNHIDSFKNIKRRKKYVTDNSKCK